MAVAQVAVAQVVAQVVIDNAEWKLYKSQLSEIVKFINNKDYDMALSKAEAFVYANPEDANGWNYAGFDK